MQTIGKVHDVPREFNFEWRIQDFFSIPETMDKAYDSPRFSFAGESWWFEIYPNGQSDQNSIGYIDVYLFRQTYDPPINLVYSLGIKTFDGKRYHENYMSDVFEEEDRGFGRIKMVKRSTLSEKKSKLLPSDSLTIVCTIENYSKSTADNDGKIKCSHCNKCFDANSASSHEKKCLDKPIRCPTCAETVALRQWYDHECDITKVKAESCSSSGNPHEVKILQDFKNLFLQKEDCDVVLKVQGREFSAHRNILKARSSVFASTFRIDMKEKNTGVVVIEDCDPSSFSDFLCFIYSGDSEVISQENIFSLFTAADKYDIQDLRAKCLEFIKENLSVNTFCDTITLALRHSEKELVQITTDFFIRNASKIILTVKWQLFLAENPTESNELLVKYFASNRSNSRK